MTSIAPSKWSMSVHGEDRWLLKIKLHVSRVYYAFALPIFAIHALILCGCISPAPQIPNIFLAELRDTSSRPHTRLRIGYFGICTSNDNVPFSCSSSIFSSSGTLATRLSSKSSTMASAKSLQSAITFITPCIAGVVFLFAMLTLGTMHALILARTRKISFLLRKENGLDIHINNLVLAARCLFWGSSAVALASANGAHMALSILQKTSINPTTTQVIRGQTMEGLLWTNFAFTVIFNIMMQSSTVSSSTTSRYRTRKSTPLPFMMQETKSKSNIDLEAAPAADPTRSESVRKLTTATAQRLALVGMHNNTSQQSVATVPRTPMMPYVESPLSANFQALNSPGLKPPLATLGRSKSTNAHHSKSSMAPVNPSTLRSSPVSFAQHRQQDRPGTAPSKRIEILAPSTRPSREQDRLAPLSPELRGILKPAWAVGGDDGSARGSDAGSSVYSRPPGSGGGHRRNPWM